MKTLEMIQDSLMQLANSLKQGVKRALFVYIYYLLNNHLNSSSELSTFFSTFTVVFLSTIVFLSTVDIISGY